MEKIQKNKVIVYRPDGEPYDITQFVTDWKIENGDVNGTMSGLDGVVQTANLTIQNTMDYNFNPGTKYYARTYSEKQYQGNGTNTYPLPTELVGLTQFSIGVLYVSGKTLTWDEMTDSWNSYTQSWKDLAVTTPDYELGTNIIISGSNFILPFSLDSDSFFRIGYTFIDFTAPNQINNYNGVYNPLLDENTKIEIYALSSDIYYDSFIWTSDGSHIITGLSFEKTPILDAVGVLTASDGVSYTTAYYDQDTGNIILGASIPAGVQLTIGVSMFDDKYRMIFSGYMGDEFNVSDDGHKIGITCRDKGKILQDCYIDRVFIDVDIEKILENLNVISADSILNTSQMFGEHLSGISYGDAVQFYDIGNGLPKDEDGNELNEIYDVIGTSDNVSNYTGDSLSAVTANSGAYCVISMDNLATFFDGGTIYSNFTFYDTGNGLPQNSMGQDLTGAQLVSFQPISLHYALGLTDGIIARNNHYFLLYFKTNTFSSSFKPNQVMEFGLMKTSVNTRTVNFANFTFSTNYEFGVKPLSESTLTVINSVLEQTLGDDISPCFLDTEVADTLIEVNSAISDDLFEKKTVWDALQELVMQKGLRLAYLYNNSTNDFELTLTQVIKKDYAQYSVTQAGIFSKDLKISGNDIRNAIAISYYDIALGDYDTASAIDEISISAYGTRSSLITESNTSAINSKTNAQKLADQYLELAKDKIIQTNLTLPFVYMWDDGKSVDLGHTLAIDYKYIENGDHIPFYSIEAIQYSYSVDSGYKTVLNGNKQKVREVVKSFVNIESKPGKFRQITNNEISNLYKIGKIENLQIIDSGLNSESLDPSAYFVLAWLRPSLYVVSNYRIDIKKTTSSWDEADSKIITNQATKIAQKIICDTKTNYDVRIYTLSSTNELGDYAEISVNAIGDSTAPAIPTGLNVSGISEGLAISFDSNTEGDLLGYKIYVKRDSEPSTSSYNVLKKTNSNRTTISGLTRGNYYVKVLAYDSSGNESDLSSAANATSYSTQNKNFGVLITTPYAEKAGDIYTDANTGIQYVALAEGTGDWTISATDNSKGLIYGNMKIGEDAVGTDKHGFFVDTDYYVEIKNGKNRTYFEPTGDNSQQLIDVDYTNTTLYPDGVSSKWQVGDVDQDYFKYDDGKMKFVGEMLLGSSRSKISLYNDWEISGSNFGIYKGFELHNPTEKFEAGILGYNDSNGSGTLKFKMSKSVAYGADFELRCYSGDSDTAPYNRLLAPDTTGRNVIDALAIGSTSSDAHNGTFRITPVYLGWIAEVALNGVWVEFARHQN